VGVKLTAQSWVTVLAIYGAGISTLAIFLALRANSLSKKAAKEAGPVFILEWYYEEGKRRLTMWMRNNGNTEITFNDLSLVIAHQVITRSGLFRLTVTTRTDPIEVIPKNRWWKGYPKSQQLPLRLAPHASSEIRVNSEGVGPLPPGIPPSELILRFVANKPNGEYEFDDISGHGFTLRHFIGLEPEGQAP
jgi:hypothetical protein